MNKIVAVVGMCGSGKSELTEFFIKKGFERIYFGGFTMEEVKKRGLEVNEKNERLVREDLRKVYGKSAYAVLAVPHIEECLKNNKNVVLDGVYSWSEYKLLREKYGDMLVVLAVVTNSGVRKQRLKNRPIRPLTQEEVEQRDISEIENLEKGGPIARADYYVINNGSKELLNSQIEEFYKTL